MFGRREAIVSSVATGVALEVGIGVLSGRHEAWDAGIYWTVGLPLALLASAAIGYLAGRRAWFWTALVVPSQVTAMMLRNGELGTLWPLAVVAAAVVGAPFPLVALAASRLPRSGRWRRT